MPHFQLSKNQNFITFNFLKNGKSLKASPVCGMTVRNCGSMRFRWNEQNPHREEVLSDMAAQAGGLTPTPVELVHSKLVLDVKTAEDTKNLQADGIITTSKKLMPVVTVADCMPLYLFDPVTEVFGVVHSGWKGTGIIGEAISLANKNYGSKPEDFSVILGPHIRSCCYIVNQERADYFAENFTPECIEPLEEGGKCYAGGKGLPVIWNNGGGKLYRLSLEKANLSVLEKSGVKKENINCIGECTCCNPLFGSNRRETAQWEAAGKIEDGQLQHFTVQAAFIYF